jgi:DNA-binding NtrC family response regulator
MGKSGGDTDKQSSTLVDSALIVSLRQSTQSELADLLAQSELNSVVAADAESARAALAKTPFPVVLIDIDSLQLSQALPLIADLRRLAPRTELIALIDEPNFETAVQLVRRGAVDIVCRASDDLRLLGSRVASAFRDAKQRGDRSQMLRDYSTIAEDLLYRLSDTARRIGELKAQINSGGRGSGSPASPTDDYVSVLVVEEDGWLSQSLAPLVSSAFSLTTVVSGGSALDRASEKTFDLALIKESLPDLPSRTVIRSLQAQSPETLVMLYLPPSRGKPGRIDRLEGTRVTTLVSAFTSAKQLAERLAEIQQAQAARRRERRYLAEFRAENYELLKRLADLRKRYRDVDSSLGRGK